MKLRVRTLRAAALLCLLLPCAARAQEPSAAAGGLRVSPSPFKLRASGVAYAGVEKSAGEDDGSVAFRRETLKPLVIGQTAYHIAHLVPGLGYEGLAAEDLKTGRWTVYPMFHLAVAAGWYKPEGKDADGNYPDAVLGLCRVGDRLWMGSNGVGVVAFDTRRRLWSRYDVKEAPVEGHHMTVWHADEGYLFVTVGEFPSARLHAYSVRRDRWLRLDAVPTANVRRYGHTGPLTQVVVDHARHAPEEYLPVDWSVAMLDRVSPLEGGAGYLFERDFTEHSSTVFVIHGWQLDAAFDSAERAASHDRPTRFRPRGAAPA